jgi:hypothetical protein
LRPFEKRRVDGLLSPLYRRYIKNNLFSTVIPAEDDVRAIQKEYYRWKNSRELEILHELIKLLEPIKAHYTHQYRPYFRRHVVDQFELRLQKFLKKCEELQEEGLSSKNLKQLQVVLWKLRFIEPYKDVKDRIAKLEMEIRPIEVAKKKEDMVRRNIAEQQRKKEEKRKKMLKEQEAKHQRQLRAKCKKYGVRSMVSGHNLTANPFRYEGQVVILSNISFEKMIDRKLGVFNDFMRKQLLVSKLPSNLFTMQGQIAQLIVRVKGTTRVTNAFGVDFNVPWVEFIDLYN